MGKLDLSRSETKAAMLAFLNGPTAAWDWDDFISVPIADPFLDAVRVVCREMPVGFPPSTGSGFYCGEAGQALMRAIAEAL